MTLSQILMLLSDNENSTTPNYNPVYYLNDNVTLRRFF